MRATTLLKKVLGIEKIIVTGLSTMVGTLVAHVRPSWRNARCHICKKPRGKYDSRGQRYWKHMDLGGVRLLLCYDLRRVNCPKHGVVVEQVPWSENPMSRFTTDFEEAVGFLGQRCDKTSIQQMFGITWRSVGSIMKRVYQRHRPGDQLDGLENIGADELSYRKGHRYLTLVSDHGKKRIVWAKEGKSAETLGKFFEELGPDRCKKIGFVSLDMGQAYIKATRKHVPQAQIVFDRFHVQKLVSEAVDKVRREAWQDLRRMEGQTEAVKQLKGLRWPLLKNSWNLKAMESERLADLQKENKPLYRAYMLKEAFVDIMNRRQPNVAKRKLENWLRWASRSRLAPFVKVAKTIRKHAEDIMAYIRFRFTNAIAEGLNNKARLLTHRAYGFHSAEATISMIMLCCSGIHLQPVRKQVAF